MSVQSAALVLVSSLALVSVVCAWACFAALRTALRRTSTSSIRVELDEIHDAIGKHSQLLKRINQRSVLAERRANAAPNDEQLNAPTLSSSDSEKAAWKARMRAQLIRPGVPVKHGR